MRARPAFVLTIRVLDRHDGSEWRRLRAFLKTALRSFGIEVVSIEPSEGGNPE